MERGLANDGSIILGCSLCKASDCDDVARRADDVTTHEHVLCRVWRVGGGTWHTLENGQFPHRFNMGKFGLETGKNVQMRPTRVFFRAHSRTERRIDTGSTLANGAIILPSTESSSRHKYRHQHRVNHPFELSWKFSSRLPPSPLSPPPLTEPPAFE